MRTKKFGKRLWVSKKTVAHLNHGEMNGARGGADTDPAECISFRFCSSPCVETLPVTKCPSGMCL